MQKSIISAKVVENSQISNISKKSISITTKIMTYYILEQKIWSQFYQ